MCKAFLEERSFLYFEFCFVVFRFCLHRKECREYLVMQLLFLSAVFSCDSIGYNNTVVFGMCIFLSEYIVARFHWVLSVAEWEGCIGQGGCRDAGKILLL